MSQYLLNTPNSYYFRIKVPLSLRSVIKKREIKISLRTEDKQRAVRLAMQHAIHYHDYIDPDKAVEELMLINGIFSTMSQVHPSAPVQMLPLVTEAEAKRPAVFRHGVFLR